MDYREVIRIFDKKGNDVIIIFLDYVQAIEKTDEGSKIVMKDGTQYTVGLSLEEITDHIFGLN